MVDIRADPLFSYTFWLCSVDFVTQTRFDAKVAGLTRRRRLIQSVMLCPSISEGGSHAEFPALGEEGEG